MDDRKTAREIADLFYTDGSHERLTNAIVESLRQAREEGRKSATPVFHKVEEFYRGTTSDGK
jgi:hypothetical protein